MLNRCLQSLSIVFLLTGAGWAGDCPESPPPRKQDLQVETTFPDGTHATMEAQGLHVTTAEGKRYSYTTFQESAPYPEELIPLPPKRLVVAGLAVARLYTVTGGPTRETFMTVEELPVRCNVAHSWWSNLVSRCSHGSVEYSSFFDGVVVSGWERNREQNSYVVKPDGTMENLQLPDGTRLEYLYDAVSGEAVLVDAGARTSRREADLYKFSASGIEKCTYVIPSWIKSRPAATKPANAR